MLLLPIFFLNCLLVRHSSAPKRLEKQTPTMSNELNSIINTKIEIKKLSEDKCYKISIGEKTEACSQVLKVHDEPMKTVSLRMDLLVQQ
jgi:hypothetical protein